MVVSIGLEPTTSILSGWHSNQLKYETIIIHVTLERSIFGKLFGLTFYEVTPLYNNEFVGPPRLELGTSASKADVLTNYTAWPNIIFVGTMGIEPISSVSETDVITVIRMSQYKNTYLPQYLLGHPGMIRDQILIRDLSLPVRRQPNIKS